MSTDHGSDQRRIVDYDSGEGSTGRDGDRGDESAAQRPRTWTHEHSGGNASCVNTTCQRCDARVSRSFVRVFAADESDGVFGCPECSDKAEIMRGGAASASATGTLHPGEGGRTTL